MFCLLPMIHHLCYHTKIHKLYTIMQTSKLINYNWFCANKLSLNAGKTKYIVIKEPYDKSDITGLSLSINGVPLSQIGNAYGEKVQNLLAYTLMSFAHGIII